MIVSASYKTDIPAFYAEWFRRRLRAGFARMTNPYSGQVHEVDLSPAGCDGFVFWTRNALPFLDTLAEAQARGFPFIVQYTVTGYPRALEASVVAAEHSLKAMHELARTYGQEAVVWRYDPVMLTSLTPPDWHRVNFARLARELRGACDEVVFSFAHIYDKTRRNTDRAAARHGFSWWNPADGEKIGLLEELAGIAAEEGFTPTLCAQPQLLREPLFTPLSAARCIDAGRLSRVAGREIAAPTKGNRPGCLCARARDIGAYDTCPHGCVYCYAVQRPDTAKHRYRKHDPESEFLVTPGRGVEKA
ncbi:DUF1848 domain-containing protein [Ferruginivarius sediminum]|uniref:DUF1848 domain-containing protein n=1 Tax=Ferruginivarius sediminum TaxID=2661937 RepID=A0A369TD94_9PROT|nr:DUF1848 domain-containing protein [Ferruginivarius sediminum]RDD63321.1 DUF1848 domain-containing protein [Ferruginivarius sediminum]